MTNQTLHKLAELLAEASNEVNPIYSQGKEVDDLWELPATSELYRYLEGLAQ